VLTGLEAALLNLQGTELVILSACDSGTGEVKIGEGVNVAAPGVPALPGRRTVLASHWKVSDKATSRLMTGIHAPLAGGEPRAKAWREAQLSLLHSKEFASPYFWAAFTLNRPVAVNAFRIIRCLRGGKARATELLCGLVARAWTG